MMSFNKFTLSKDKKLLTFEHEDPGGGCCHELYVKALLKALKPTLTNPKVIGTVSLANIEENCERIEARAYREIYADIVNRLNEAVILHNEIKPNGNVMIKGGAISEILKEYTIKLREITLKCQSPKEK